MRWSPGRATVLPTVVLASVVAACSGDEASVPSTTTVIPTTTMVPGEPVDDLVAGDCLEDLPAGPEALAVTVDCGRAHRAEVYAVHEFEDGPFPGAERLEVESALRCSALYEDYAGEPLDPTTDRAFAEAVPSEGSWTEGDRRVVCLALPPAGDTEEGTIAADATAGSA